MKYDGGSNYTLSTGREVYAFSGIFGLAPGDSTLYYGYDSTCDEADDFTPEERAEIADEMIRRWQAWKANS
jgi:hypothetical protein